VLLIVAVLLLNYPANADWDSPRFWVTALCFAFALPGIFAATAKNRLSNWLGDLSYPLYLIHLLVMAIMLNTGFFRDLDSPITAATTYTASCFVAAAVARYLLEAPTAYALQAFRDCVKIGSNLALERLVRAR
jgi:peptidoglycan/LPS O-acetylase OafA/YrhL